MKGLKLLASMLTDTPDVSMWSWATVTQASPLRVKLDGEDDPLDITPDSLVGGLAVGQRVWVQLVTNPNPAHTYRRLVVLGAAVSEFVKRVTTETQNNTTTLTNDGVLFFTPPVAGTTWEIEIWGAYTATATGKFKCGFDVTAGNNMRWTLVAPSSADTSKSPFDYRFDNSTESLGRFGTYNPLHIKGVYSANNADPLYFRWAQDAADAGPTFVLQQTFMRATQIP